MSDELERLQQEFEDWKFDQKFEQLQQEADKYFNDSRFQRGLSEMSDMFTELNESDAFQSVSEGFGMLSNRFSILSVLLEVLSPIFDVVNGLMDVFVGRMMQNLQPALSHLFEVLQRPEMQVAIKFIADLFTGVLSPVMSGIASFIKLLFGTDTSMTTTEIGAGIGAVIGMVVGAALASYIGMPWLGAIIGAYLGQFIGGGIGAIFEPAREPQSFTDAQWQEMVNTYRNQGLLDEFLGQLKQDAVQAGEKDKLNWILQHLIDMGLITPEEASSYWLAAGGVITSAVSAIVGEAGAEAVMPLEEVFDMSGEDTDQLNQIIEALHAQNRMLINNNQGIVRRRFG